jgi:CO/xanthine dehydrogenase Mo-binding subunit
VLEAAAEKSNYLEKRRAISRGPKRRGMGISLAFHGAGFTGSGEVRLDAHAGVELTERGARILSISTDIGQGTITVFAQMAADALGLRVDDVEVAENDTSKMPDSGPTVASRTTMVVGGTITKAAAAMAKILCDFAGAEDCRQGVFLKGGKPVAPFAAVAKEYLSKRGPLKIIENYRHPQGIFFDDETYRGDAYPCYGWAATAVEVEVDTDTYETTLVSVTTATDVGKAIHPVLAEGQIEGGTVQALGYALLEEHLFAPDGKMLNTRMQNYVIPTALDIPPMQTLLLENAYPHGPYGAKGLGELPMDGPAPAVLAAVLHATGKLIPELPISPDRLMRAML